MQDSRVMERRRSGPSGTAKRWPKLGVSVLLGMAGFVVRPNAALAESGVPYCRPASVVELFAGAPGCEQAAYLVVELEMTQPSSPIYSSVNVYVEGPDDSQYINIDDVVAQDAGAGTRILIGTSAVRDTFGITPDLTVDTLPFAHHMGGVELCYINFSYRANAGSHMCAGDALRLEDGRWVNSIPDPGNAKGQSATRWNCPGASWAPSLLDAGGTHELDAAAILDGSVGDANTNAVADAAPPPADPGLCDPSVFEPVPDPSTGATSTSMPAGSEPGSSSAPTLPHVDTGSGTTSDPGAATTDTTKDTSSAVSTDQDTLDTPPQSDAGSAPPGPPASEGCDCRVGRSGAPPSGALAWALFASGLTVFRRRGRQLFTRLVRGSDR